MAEGQTGVTCENLWTKMIGKPYSGKLNVRSDEGELEIEPIATTPALYSTVTCNRRGRGRNHFDEATISAIHAVLLGMLGRVLFDFQTLNFEARVDFTFDRPASYNFSHTSFGSPKYQEEVSNMGRE